MSKDHNHSKTSSEAEECAEIEWVLSQGARQVLNFLVKHHQRTGKKGVYCTQEEFAELTGVDPSTLGSSLRELENAGLVTVYGRSRYGVPYIHLTDRAVSTTAIDDKNSAFSASVQRTLGVQGGATPTRSSDSLLPRVHFLEAVASVKDVFPHQDLEFDADAARVQIIFGQYRRKITLTMRQNRPGLSYDEFTNVLGRAWSLIEQKLSRRVEPSEFKVVNLHLSIDFLNLRLDGVRAVTLSDARGWLARLYNKGDLLRSETVVGPGVITLDQAYALMGSSLEEHHMLLGIREGVRRLLTSTYATTESHGGRRP